jgi:hypothetical protein
MGFFPLQRNYRGSPLSVRGATLSLRSAFRVSRPLGGLLLATASQPYFMPLTLMGFTLQGISRLRDPVPFRGRLPSCCYERTWPKPKPQTGHESPKNASTFRPFASSEESAPVREELRLSGDPHQRLESRSSRCSPARQLQGFAPSQRATVLSAGEDARLCRSPRGFSPLQGFPPCRGRTGFPIRTLSFLGSPDPKAKFAVNLRASFAAGLVQLARGRKSNIPSWGFVPFRHLR